MVVEWEIALRAQEQPTPGRRVFAGGAMLEELMVEMEETLFEKGPKSVPGQISVSQALLEVVSLVALPRVGRATLTQDRSQCAGQPLGCSGFAETTPKDVP